MISKLVAKDFGCLRDVTVDFGGIHALIGPNDSGKSTLLRALRSVSQLVRGSFEREGEVWLPFDPGFSFEQHKDVSPGHFTSLDVSTPWGTYTFQHSSGPVMGRPRGGYVHVSEGYTTEGGAETHAREFTKPSEILSRLPGPHPAFGLAEDLSAVHYFAFSEEGLRRPGGFLSGERPFLTPYGEGLPGVYFALRNDREEAFERILDSVRSLFPTVRTVRTQPRSSSELELEIELQDRTRVRAPHVSTGLLYYLAFAAIPEFSGGLSTILLEEPENGLHPARIREVLAVLRTMHEQHNAQVIMTTHSPLVINELKPEEVSVVTRPSVITGTVVTKIADTPNFEKRSGVYALGELWLSYADGKVEAPLFDPKTR